MIGPASTILSNSAAGRQANPFECLQELQRHTEPVAAAPADGLPWSYHGPFVETVRQSSDAPSSSPTPRDGEPLHHLPILPRLPPSENLRDCRKGTLDLACPSI